MYPNDIFTIQTREYLIVRWGAARTVERAEWIVASVDQKPGLTLSTLDKGLTILELLAGDEAPRGGR